MLARCPTLLRFFPCIRGFFLKKPLRKPIANSLYAETLAARLGVSTRTVYRDIADLVAQGADIRGEAGVGFVLKHDFGLPPLGSVDIQLLKRILRQKMADARRKHEPMPSIGKCF